jgi:hypothetical protein
MEKLVLDGKEFIKASKAAKDLGYTSDYVGQLCRSGKVSAHLVGRTWYVLAEELTEHKTEKKRSSRVKARAQAKRAIEEHKLKAKQSPKTEYTHVAIRYENDDAELIPATRKLHVETERDTKATQKPHFEERIPEEPAITIENEGKKVIMSGDLEIVDVTDAPVDPDVVHLAPKIIKTPKTRNGKNDISAVIQEPEFVPDTFEEKLSRIDVLNTQSTTQTASDITQEVEDTFSYDEVLNTETKQPSLLPYVFFILILIGIGVASVGLQTSIQYVHDEYMKVSTVFSGDVYSDIYTKIRLKI